MWRPQLQRWHWSPRRSSGQGRARLESPWLWNRRRPKLRLKKWFKNIKLLFYYITGVSMIWQSLTGLKLLGVWLKPIIATSATKNDARYLNDQKWRKYNYLASLIQVCDTYCCIFSSFFGETQFPVLLFLFSSIFLSCTL